MTSDAAQTRELQGVDDIRIRAARVAPDFVTILGIIFALGLIAAGIAMGNSDASFLDAPSFVIVILGTIAATSVAYSADELKHVPGILGSAMFRRIRKPSDMARQLMDIAMLARKKGVLALAGAEAELRKDPFLADAVQLVTDGFSGEDIERVLGQEIDSLVERHRRAANIMRRAAEIAPAMGLIGTLIGLVQMLANLQDPNAIGPAMAVALLTTFYGAILSNVVLSPLAGKLERNSNDETMIKTLVMTAASSIARQENPRRLEMLLNSELPPDERIEYFD